MYFIPFIRDYIEILNNIYDSALNDINFIKVFQESFIYLFQTLKFITFYLFTFQWFHDLIYLPTLIPQVSNSIIKENFFLETPLENFFNFLEFPSYSNNKLFIGILNSFFLSLPLSCAHLIYIRRLIIQGNIAGIVAGLGNIFGQILFISSILFGFRFFIFPWFSFDSFNIIIGLVLLINMVYDMTHERIIRIVDWTNKSILIKIFLLNFFLIWTEQSCIFQFFGNITGSSEPSVLEIFASNSNFDFSLNHLKYLTGLFLGSLFFNYIFALVLTNLSEYIQLKFHLLKSTWINQINFILLTTIIAFSFTSIPYYSLDFLLMSPLGFISNDKAFKNTIFSEEQIYDEIGLLGGLSDFLSVNTDIVSFDRAFYLQAPILHTFEDLNFSGEYASTIRQGYIPLYDQYTEQARQIRDLIIKKNNGDVQYQQKTIENPKKTKTNKNKDFSSNLIYYPTHYRIETELINKYKAFDLQRRFEVSYAKASNPVFANILEGTLSNGFTSENLTSLFPEIQKKIKEKYYTNPIYKSLLAVDVDTFLKRQPPNYSLSINDEMELFEVRLMLKRYHETLRLYNKLSYSNEFEYFFTGSKSFSTRVYNQQFKGTLHMVSRLFSISLDQNSKQRVLKYDQPLFKETKDYQLTFHEELRQKSRLRSPFLEGINQNPFYLGWDDSTRKIVISNRLLPKLLGNFTNVNNKPENLLEFTTWPLKKEQLVSKNITNLESSLFKNSQFLFQTKSSIEELNYPRLLPLFEYDEDRGAGLFYYDTLPNNITNLNYSNIDFIPPNRSGFVWPGNDSLKLFFKNSLKAK